MSNPTLITSLPGRFPPYSHPSLTSSLPGIIPPWSHPSQASSLPSLIPPWFHPSQVSPFLVSSLNGLIPPWSHPSLVPSLLCPTHPWSPRTKYHTYTISCLRAGYDNVSMTAAEPTTAAQRNMRANCPRRMDILTCVVRLFRRQSSGSLPLAVLVPAMSTDVGPATSRRPWLTMVGSCC